MTHFYQQRWQQLQLPVLTTTGTELWVCHLQCRVPAIAGNKWLKLKYHIQHIQQYEKTGILSFGGAFSNHLAALAAAGKSFGFQTHAFVRQTDPTLVAAEALRQSPTLQFCQQQGMTMTFCEPSTYRQRAEPAFLTALQQRYPNWLLVPEGGSSAAGVQGVAELNLGDTPAGPADLICCATGSGGTVAGLALGHPRQQVLGISVVKDNSLPARIRQLNTAQNWQLRHEAEGLRYGSFNPAILQTCLNAAVQGLPVEPIYTGKALHSLLCWLADGQLAGGQRLVLFHTGGLQGLAGLLAQQRITQDQYNVINSAGQRLLDSFSRTPA